MKTRILSQTLPGPKLVSFALLLVICLIGPAAGESPKLKLQVVQAYDHRLPVPSASDMGEIFAEATKIMARQFGTEPFWIFVDAGVESFPTLFKGDYRTKEFNYWVEKHQYPLEGTPDFEKAKPRIVAFLSAWSLDELRQMVPSGRQINNYDDAFKVVTEAYSRKIEILRQLRLASGDYLLFRPAQPFQSLLHWRGMMHAQDKYDVFITNTLIVSDIYTSPYPHSVMKEAKVSGSLTLSPKRQGVLKHSTMVSVLEEYSDIPFFHDETKPLPRHLKNKIIGSALAHELGHAIFYVPDVYDHGDTCVMNSSYEKLSHMSHYEKIAEERLPCAKCIPYVVFRLMEIEGEAALEAKNYSEAAAKFVRAVDAMPDRMLDTLDRNRHIGSLYRRAVHAYEQAGDEAGAARVREMWKAKKEKPPIYLSP